MVVYVPYRRGIIKSDACYQRHVLRCLRSEEHASILQRALTLTKGGGGGGGGGGGDGGGGSSGSSSSSGRDSPGPIGGDMGEDVFQVT